MSKHEKWTCMICKINKVNVTVASDGSHTDFGYGPNRPVCKDSECRNEMDNRMKEHYDKLNKKEAEKILEQIQGIMNRKEKLTIDFEKYDLTEEQKEICRKYVKSNKEVEDLKKQRQELEEKQKEELNNLLKCDECRKIPSNKKYYEVGGKGNYCKSCAEEIVNNSNKTTYESPTSNENPCEQCGLIFSKYYNISGKGRYCSSCANKIIESKKNQSSSNQRNNNQNVGEEKQNIEENFVEIRPIVNSVLEGKRKIDQGLKINIDGSPLIESQKEELKDYRLKRVLGDSPKVERGGIKSLLLYGGIAGLVITLLIIIIKIRPKKRKLKKRIRR